MKIAILGASGIGKNHARWFQKHGAKVVAFLGSSPHRLPATQELLEKNLGYAPRGFCDLDELLSTAKPDAVCVSNPPSLHFAHVEKCLRAGAHVLCEKPLVGDDALPREELVAQANALVEIARNCDVLLGTQMQYALAAPLLLEMTRVARGEPIRRWAVEMETKNVRPGRAGAAIWVDLSPHPLSVLQQLGATEILTETISCNVGELETRAHFHARLKNQSEACECEIVVRVNAERASPRRRFSFNERSVDFSARNNASGEFKAFWSNGETEIERDDLADSLIANFVAACAGRAELRVSGEHGAQNVAWQLEILERGKQDKKDEAGGFRAYR